MIVDGEKSLASQDASQKPQDIDLLIFSIVTSFIVIELCRTETGPLEPPAPMSMIYCPFTPIPLACTRPLPHVLPIYVSI